ncbi:MAG TPA: DUF4975 domain-containing protein [Epulopiscium sp.]|nr:DUF4975 domain-containing protein [Candidatus Epulonipiscium sp.]
MRSLKLISINIFILIILVGCNSNKELGSNLVNNKEEIKTGNDKLIGENDVIDYNTFKIFMTSKNNFVGDLMPLTDDEGIHLYYLYDTDNNGRAYHPIHKFSTTNLYEYSDDGLAIPFSTSEDEPDLAIGTGSFILVDGVYHSFYTGHNDTFGEKGLDKERIMHAISHDNINWTKIPEDTFLAPEGYSSDDFRDPSVFWNEEDNCYWMLISARNEDLNGFIALYKSDDLSKWALHEPLYAPNKYHMMECPDLFKMGEHYYMFYSWNNVTYYAMSDSVYGPFYEPEDNVLDGQAFYAAKTALYEGKRYLFAFINRKNDQKDSNNYSWAGNVAVYELSQGADGRLRALMPSQFNDYFKKEIELPKTEIIGEASYHGGLGTVKSDGESISAIDFGKLPQTMLLKAKLTLGKKGKGIGFFFGKENGIENALGIHLDPNKNLLRYDSSILSRMRYAEPVVYSSFEFEEGREYDVKIVVENEIIVLYMDDTKVLSNRIYKARGNDWGLFSIGGDATLEDIQLLIP